MLMVDPPREGKESDTTVELHKKEYNAVFEGLKERAKLLSDKLNAMENITCNSVQGSMYAFPQLHMTESAIEAARKKKVAADFMYCMDMLNETGI